MKFVRQLPVSGGGVNMALYQCEQCRHTVAKPVEKEVQYVPR